MKWFQHDGAPPHNTMQVKNYLDQKMYLYTWIGRNGPITWPRSSDLSVFDLFLWGTIKKQKCI